MNLKNRQDFLVMLVIAAAALFVGVNFVFTPLQNWWAARQTQVRQLRDQVKEGNTLLKREKFVRAQWSDMCSNSLSASAPQAEQQLLQALDNWSGESRAEIASIMPQPWKSDSTNYMTLNCRVEVNGDMDALTKFIYDIEKGPMAVRLDSVEISTHDNNGQQLTLGIEVNGLALLHKDKK